MAYPYIKTIWEDRVDNTPAQYIVDGEIKTITKDNTGIIVAGTPVNANNMMKLENEMEESVNAIENQQGEIEQLTTDVVDSNDNLNGYILRRFYGLGW